MLPLWVFWESLRRNKHEPTIELFMIKWTDFEFKNFKHTLNPQFYIQLLYRPHFGPWNLPFGLLGLHWAVSEKFLKRRKKISATALQSYIRWLLWFFFKSHLSPSSIYSCSIDQILEHEFCHLGFWALSEKQTEFLLKYATFWGGFFMFSWAKIKFSKKKIHIAAFALKSCIR